LTPAPPAADRRRWRALAVSQLAAFMALLDVSIVNVALPSIQEDLNAAPSTAQWVVSGYALTFALVLVPAGRIGDSLGRRKMFLVGLTAFVVTSALTGLAPTAGLLVAARLLQGFAGGLLIPQNTGLVQELFQGEERGRAFGIIGATVGIATATGPIAGGLILSAVPGAGDWRWIFFVNVPIGLVALLSARRFVPDRAAGARRRPQLDVVGALLLGGGVLSALLPVVDIRDAGLRWLFGLSVVLLAAFAWWETRTTSPLLPPTLLRVTGFPAGTVIGLVYFISFTGIWLVLALYLQHGLGYSPLGSGLAVTPFAVGSAVSAAVAGRLVPRLGRWLTVIGLATTAVGLIVTAMLLRHVDAWTAVALFVAGLGGGMVISPNLTLTLQNVPVDVAGGAGGAVQTAQRMGAAIGSAVLVTIFYHRLDGASGDYAAAVTQAIRAAAAMTAVALILSIVDLVRQRRRASSVGEDPALGVGHDVGERRRRGQ
jgi:EmrB/QacA subfamily drug resistance transporter